MEKIKQFTLQCLIFIIRLYQYLISPLFGHHCRFYPSCSSYSADSFLTHGVIHGFYLSVRRILRCHPWSQGGLDPVPTLERNKHANKYF